MSIATASQAVAKTVHEDDDDRNDDHTYAYTNAGNILTPEFTGKKFSAVFQLVKDS